MILKKFSVVAFACLIIQGCDEPKNDSMPSVHPDPQEVGEAQDSAVSNTSFSELEQLFRESARELFKARPMAATSYGLSVDDVGEYYANQVEDYAPESEQGLRSSMLRLSKNLSRLPKKELSMNEQISVQVMENITRYYAGHPDFPIGYIDTWMGLSPFIINQINGPLIDLPRFMQSDQPITNEQEALDYIARLAQYDQFVDGVLAKYDSDKERNWIPPKIVLKGAARYLTNFLKPQAKNNPLFTSFVEKVEKADLINFEKRQVLLDEALRQMEDVVYPSYQKAQSAVITYIGEAREEAGIWAQPAGDVYYQDAILQLGDSALTADTIHSIGLNEVKRISQAMDARLISAGYRKGSVAERMVALGENPKYLYVDTEEGRKKLLNDLNSYIEEITQKMEPVFKTKPPYDVEVRSFPVEIQDGAPGGQYSAPSVDGSKPGVYWINLKDMKANPTFSLKTLTYHEANPGHHWQIALNLAQSDLPFLRRIAPYNAYVEGWALYSEQIAQEIGMYEKDPMGDLGRLQAELFRAVRLVVDTGMHHKKWTREQAIAYMSKTTGSAESDVVAEIERYMAWPGQALGYKLGMLKILELRQNAKTQLAEKFDLAEFHDLILLGGAVPMSVLEKKVKRWVEHVKSNN